MFFGPLRCVFGYILATGSLRVFASKDPLMVSVGRSLVTRGIRNSRVSSTATFFNIMMRYKKMPWTAIHRVTSQEPVTFVASSAIHNAWLLIYRAREEDRKIKREDV